MEKHSHIPPEMIEANKVKCRSCEKLVVKIKAEKMKDGKRYTYRDDRGELWNGRQCPDCNQERINSFMRKKRAGINY